MKVPNTILGLQLKKETWNLREIDLMLLLLPRLQDFFLFTILSISILLPYNDNSNDNNNNDNYHHHQNHYYHYNY